MLMASGVPSLVSVGTLNEPGLEWKEKRDPYSYIQSTILISVIKISFVFKLCELFFSYDFIMKNLRKRRKKKKK